MYRTIQTTVVARLGRHRRRPERFALILADGTVSNWFGVTDSREEIAALLARAGLALHDDDTVTRP